MYITLSSMKVAQLTTKPASVALYTARIEGSRYWSSTPLSNVHVTASPSPNRSIISVCEQPRPALIDTAMGSVAVRIRFSRSSAPFTPEH